MKLKLLTYNILLGSAAHDARKIAEAELPDIICIQEIPTDVEALKIIERGRYKLAAWSNSFVKHWNIYGIATYINTETIGIVSGRNGVLPSGVYDLWVWLSKGMYMSRSFLETRIIHKQSNTELVVYNAHLTHLSFVDHRLAQLKTIMAFMRGETPDFMPTVICGDFNLYNGKTELEAMLEQFSLKEATTNLAYTFSHPWWFGELRLKLDYILYRNLTLRKTTRLPRYSSDHHPIVSEFEL